MNRTDRRAAEKVCRKEGHLLKNEIAYCVRCGLSKVKCSYRPNGSWSCIKDHVTEPCGQCGPCREIQGWDAPFTDYDA